MNPAPNKQGEPAGEYKYWLLIIALVVIAGVALLGPVLSDLLNWLGRALGSIF